MLCDDYHRTISDDLLPLVWGSYDTQTKVKLIAEMICDGLEADDFPPCVREWMERCAQDSKLMAEALERQVFLPVGTVE